jgi:murein L,D-transpeptidase YcbB/YkuD
VKASTRAGKALILALFSVALADCGSRSGVQPKQVDAGSLQSAVTDAQVRAFYQARQWQPAWDGKGERALLDAIGQAPAQGLKPDLFLKQPLPADPNEREAALTKAALGYAAALARGYVDPTKLGRPYTIPRPKPDVVGGLSQAVQKGDVAGWLASLPPQTDEYRALSQAYVRYLKLATAVQRAQVPAGKPIRPGQSDPRVPQLIASLTANGYLAPPQSQQNQQANTPQRYSGAIVAAVRRMQADFGLKPKGVIDADTLAVLNGGAGYRGRQVAVALERLRWLERTPPDTRIDVNTAASFLDYWRSGAHQQQLRVVNGQPDEWTTPQIQAPIFQLVANPYWRVPDRILEDELSKKSAAYLAANGFSMRNGRMIQLPGPKNSLGEVKFDMRDPQQIYLHDTPFKSWFAVNDRHRSHGCVRVQNALDFANQLASEDGVADKFQEALASGDENYVKLRREIPVRLFYHTAYWDGSRVQLVPDVYGWDDDVARPLGLEHGPPRVAYQRREDLGP